MKELLKSYILRLKPALTLGPFLYFFLYYFMFFAIIVFVNSLFTFMHFRLGHDLSTIEDWIFHKRWEIVIFSKLASAFLMYKFLKIQIDDFVFFKKLFKVNFTLPSMQFWVFLSFISIVIALFGRASLVGPVGLFWEFKLTSYLGGIIYFVLDALLILSLIGIRQLNWKNLNLITPFLALFPVIGFYIAFLGDAEYLVASYFLSFYFFYFFSESTFDRSLALIFLFVFIGPCFFIFGLDPLWGGSFSILKINDTLGIGFWLPVLALGIIYLHNNDLLTRLITRKYNEYRRNKLS